MEFFKSLVKAIQELNKCVKVELCTYAERTYLPSIEVRGVGLPMDKSLELPEGAFWKNKNTIVWHGREAHLVPYP